MQGAGRGGVRAANMCWYLHACMSVVRVILLKYAVSSSRYHRALEKDEEGNLT